MTWGNKRSSPFEVRPYGPEDYAYLVEMYDSFSPKAKFQGMPPREESARHEWVKHLIDTGDSFLAWQEGTVIGHVVLLPDFNKGDAEYLIFVSQQSRGRGVGTELTRTAITRAEDLGLKIIWLTVDAYNFRATRLYKKFGFQFSDAYRSASERMMSYHCESGNGGA
jgi:RimJ/RimL family protein N-acetyltransferase